MDENLNKAMDPVQDSDNSSVAPANTEVPVNSEEKPPSSRNAVIGFVFGITLPSVILVPIMWNLLRLGESFSDSGLFTYGLSNFNYIDFDMLDISGIILFLTLTAMAIAAVVYSVNIVIKKMPFINYVWIIASASCCIWFAFAFMRLSFYYDLITSENFLFLSALSMTIILVSMTGILLWTSPEDKKLMRRKSLLLFLAVPIFWYILLNLVMYAFDNEFLPMWMLIFIAAVYGLIFLVLHVLFLVSRKKGPGPRVLQIIILFILPSLGLLISQSFGEFSFFWDFSSPIYYLLVLLNGILLILPEPLRTPFRVLLLFAKGAMFLFVLYFFMCLSPFYALALPGIIYYGIGILILAPLFLIVYQTKNLIPRLVDFSHSFGRLKTAAVFILGMLMLPLCLTLYSVADRANIETALSIMDGDLDAGDVNLFALRNSLDYMYSFNSNQPPLISSIYKNAATNGGILSESSYERAQALFFAEKSSITGRGNRSGSVTSQGSPDVKISDVKVETRRDGDDFKSLVYFTLDNTGSRNTQEYVTSFILPDGVFISDYYLDVLGEKKNGILSVKQAAILIYNRVVSSSRDPGILYYDGDAISFKVFPFSAGETRYTGIEFLHKEPVTLEIDNNKIALETDEAYLNSPVELDGAVYFGAEYKKRLAPVIRKPGYAFVIDCSRLSDTGGMINRLKQFCADNKINPADATVTALNYRAATFPMSGDWEKVVMRFSHEGGFGVDAVSDELYKIHSNENTYPVMIILSDNIDSALLPSDTSYMSRSCPELDGYFILSGEGMSLYPFNKNTPVAKIDVIPEPKPGLAAQNAILRDDGQPQIVIGESIASSQDTGTLSGQTWENGIRLAAKAERLRFSSGQNHLTDTLNIIKDSFATGIMTPQTSYIVLETSAQEERLKAIQQQMLDSGNLNAGDMPVRMSEPPMTICIAIIFLAIWVLRRRKKLV